MIVGGIEVGHEFQIVGDNIICIHCQKTHHKNPDLSWPIDREICLKNPINQRKEECPVKF